MDARDALLVATIIYAIAVGVIGMLIAKPIVVALGLVGILWSLYVLIVMRGV